MSNELEPDGDGDGGRTRDEGEKPMSLWRRESCWDWEVDMYAKKMMKMKNTAKKKIET
ncbi:hypothetical protein A2U01_0045162, partial [Trifolium medium]|nr:hypothetical protein [Trifolium medium]